MNLKGFLFIYSILFIQVFKINTAAKISEKKEENIDLNNALLEAIKNGDEHRVDELIKDGANVNARLWKNTRIYGQKFVNRIVKTFPINEATSMGNVNIIKLLLDSGANINQLDGEVISPLMRSALDGEKDIVRFLLSAGANINLKNLAELTALELAKSALKIQKNFAYSHFIEAYQETVELLEEAKLKQDLEEKRKKTTQILIESGHLIEPLAKLTAEYAVAQEDILTGETPISVNLK